MRALRAAQIPLIKKAKARQIADRVQEIKQFTAAVAASVQQQDAATGEISHNVASAARQTKEILSVFHEVASAATETRGSAEPMLDTSKSVETAATDLRTEVEGLPGKGGRLTGAKPVSGDADARDPPVARRNIGLIQRRGRLLAARAWRCWLRPAA